MVFTIRRGCLPYSNDRNILDARMVRMVHIMNTIINPTLKAVLIKQVISRKNTFLQVHSISSR